jgi:hypothetical protein
MASTKLQRFVKGLLSCNNSNHQLTNYPLILSAIKYHCKTGKNQNLVIILQTQKI